MLENKTIQGMSDLEFAAHILQLKLNKVQNPNTPFAAKLRQTITDLRHLADALAVGFFQVSWCSSRYYREELKAAS